jgi:hypothetical protein
MTSLDRKAYWENVYTIKDEREVSWFEERPSISLDLIRSGVNTGASIIDIGGGRSRLVEALIDEGFESLTILDLSETALATAKVRLGAHSAKVQWVVADVTTWEPSETYDVWHDRAAFHFLTEPTFEGRPSPCRASASIRAPPWRANSQTSRHCHFRTRSREIAAPPVCSPS